MTKSEFIDELKEIMEIDELSESRNLHELEEFDSLAVMSIIALSFAKFNVRLSGDAIKSAGTAGELIELIGSEKFD